ncbi:Lectin BRA-3, partial [Armadillidium nasatum]
MRKLKKFLWRNRLCTTLNRALCERYAEPTVRYTCPEKWFRNFEVCYHISTERVTYDEAAKKCPSLAFGSKFFAPRDSIENNFISGRLREEKINSVWIGINDVDEEENFETEDEAKQTFFNWDNREPSDTFNKLIKNNDCV